MTGARRLVSHWLAPAVLVAVASLQLVRAHTLEQSSWSGGGFGMFATYENEDSRFLRIWAVRADGETRVALPARLERRGFEARVVPTGRRLDALARDIAALIDDPTLETVRVEVWRIDFEHPSARIAVRELASAGSRGEATS